ncbi:MAG: peptide-methionine (R)-S-oxide reductase MsrB [Marinobacter sp.]|uniref:peptide-methionine (R)-S-oxide reductase MsrB n=1 Tax=Marinobacter sp. TaxID=50741 RepID=UPI00299CEDD5|nr:peptide-methionine (R)-S-oxide reductase MsrB [Marinobacter sp.]MDX1634583.1 peptide-methionine (R)-S-oxide reductase MsrB [Marinobacter sp.]
MDTKTSKPRRQFLKALSGVALLGLAGTSSLPGRLWAAEQGAGAGSGKSPDEVDWKSLTEEQWRQRLTEEEFEILREEGTEPAFSSPLNAETRKGTYICAGCALPLFSSETKFESGTGWPSFYEPLPDAVDTKTDYKLLFPRTEYHCRRCGGHQGHVFDDGPEPTGKRWCNNGRALDFRPAEG